MIACAVLLACGDSSLTPEADAARPSVALSDAGLHHDARAERASDATAHDANTDADGSRAAGGSHVTDGRPLPTCEDGVPACSPGMIGELPELLKASDFGPTAQLVAMSEEAVLVQVDPQHFQVVFFPLPDGLDDAETPAPKIWDLPSSERRPTAFVHKGWGDLGSQLFVLACDDTRTACSVLQSSIENAEPAAWRDLEVPPDLAPRHIAIDVADERQPVCVYGNGLACFFAGWEEPIPSTRWLRLNHIKFQGPHAVAVGDHGRWFLRERDPDSGSLGTWIEQAPLADVSLDHASAQDSWLLILGEGKLQLSRNASTSLIECSPPGEELMAMLFDPYFLYSYAVTRSGAVLRHRGQRFEPYCVLQQQTLSAPILAVDSLPCASSLNPRVLTRDALYGTDDCLHRF